MKTKNTLSLVLSHLTAEELAKTHKVSRLWYASSKEGAKISLRRYLSQEVINSLLFPTQTLRCFERLFETAFINETFYEHCDLFALRGDYTVTSFYQHVLCFPYIDKKTNNEFFSTIGNMNPRAQKKIMSMAIALHNFKLLNHLINNVNNFFEINANVIVSANSTYLIRLMVLPEQRMSKKHLLKALETPPSFTLMKLGTDLLENRLNDSIDDIDETKIFPDRQTEKLRTNFSEGRLCFSYNYFSTARRDAILIFPDIAKITSFIENNNLDGLKQFYCHEILNEDLIRATIAMLLTCQPHIIKKILEWGKPSLRPNIGTTLVGVLFLYAIYHNDIALFNQLGCDIEQSYGTIEQSFGFFLQAISFYRSDKFYSAFAKDVVYKLANGPVKMSFLQCDSGLADAFIKEYLKKNGLDNELSAMVITYGNVRLIKKMFRQAQDKSPTTIDLITAINANVPTKLDVLIQLNPSLKLEKDHLWIAIANDQLKMTMHLIDKHQLTLDQMALNLAVHYNAASVVNCLVSKYKLILDQTTLTILDNEDVACEIPDMIDLSNTPGLLVKLDFVFEFFRCKNLYSKSDIKHLLSSKGIDLSRVESPSPL